jgi:hypothetical protein
MVFVPNHQPPKILEPREETFNFPSPRVPAKLPSVLGSILSPVPSVWCNQFDAALLKEQPIKSITVVGLVSNDPVRSVLGESVVYCRFNQNYLMGRSAFHVSGDRNTRSVCNCHDLGALAALCLADSKTPFFAGTKVPSMNASLMSIPPRSYRSCASSMTRCRKTPCRTHCWNRLWHVWYGGYRGGRSFQGAPVRKIHNIPFKTSRASRAGRPRGSFGGADAITLQRYYVILLNQCQLSASMRQIGPVVFHLGP